MHGAPVPLAFWEVRVLRTLVLGLLPIAAGLLLSSATAGARSSLTTAAASKTSLTTTSSASTAVTTDGR